jgi:hypothetical protein
MWSVFGKVLATCGKEDGKGKKFMEKVTMEQAVIISAYTGILLCPVWEMQKAVEKKLGRGILQVELLTEKLQEEIKEKFREDFIALAPVVIL